MSASIRFLVLVFVIVLAATSATAAGDDKKPRTDLYGDPLPRGAVARLGSVRFRFARVIKSLAFSPDGKRLAGSSSRRITIWDVATGKRIREFKLDSVIVRLVGFAPDGKVLALATDSPRALDDYPTLVLLRPELRPKPIYLQSVAINTTRFALSPDGRRLLVLGGTRPFWNLATGAEVDLSANAKKTADGRTFLIPPLEANIALSPDHRTVAHADFQTNAVHLVDLHTKKTIRKLGGTAQQYSIYALIFSHDGKSLISMGKRGLFLWDVAGEKRPRCLVGKEASPFAATHPPDTLAVAVSPDGKTIATVDEDQHVIVLWNTATGRGARPEGMERGALTTLSYADEKTLVTIRDQKRVCFWDAVSGKCRHRLTPEQVFGQIPAVSAGGKLLAGLTEDNHVVVWDTATEKTCWQSATPLVQVTRLVFAPDGKTLLGMVEDGDASRIVDASLIVCWDAATGKTIQKIALPFKGNSPLFKDNNVLSSADGSIIAAGDDRKEVRLFRAHSGRQRRPLREPIHLPIDGHAHALSPDGRTLLVKALNQGYYHLGLVETVSGGFVGWLRSETEGFDGSVEDAVFSPDSKMIAATYGDGTVRIWDVVTRRELEHFTADKGESRRIAFSPDGQTVASARLDRTVLVWQVRPSLDLDGLWDDLASEDVKAALWAISKLTASPHRSVPYLAKRLPPLPRGDGQRLRQLIADLDSEAYTVRQKAFRELEKEGEGAEDALCEVLEGKPSLELRRRTLELLGKLEDARRHISREDVRVMRTVQVLETIGTSEARQVLKKLSEGASGALRTREARATLRRLEK
ncbi:MAG TPA: WD40 repeat domain-containing protein [Gemmataceae bacterium]|jgi:WD40 repeat protein